MTAVRTYTILTQFFPNKVFVLCIDGAFMGRSTPATQLLMKQFDTLPIQYRHIEHMHEGACLKKFNLWQNDSYEFLDNYSLIWLLYMHG